jgi:hypothetical protein
MKRYMNFSIIILLLVVNAIAYADYYNPPGCDNRRRPLLQGLSLIVNNKNVKMPAVVRTTDNVKIAVQYSDADCDLEGGRIWIESDSGDIVDLIHGYTIGPIGCSSKEEGKPYFLTIDPMDYLLPEGLERTLPLQLYMEDSCTYTSKPFFLPLDFTVTDGDVLIDDDDTAASQASDDDDDHSGSGGCAL